MKNQMEILYKEMQDRLKYLETQEQTEEIKWRIQEITLAIVRVQQLLLPVVIGSKPKRKTKSKQEDKSFFQKWDEVIKKL